MNGPCWPLCTGNPNCPWDCSAKRKKEINDGYFGTNTTSTSRSSSQEIDAADCVEVVGLDTAW